MDTSWSPSSSLDGTRNKEGFGNRATRFTQTGRLERENSGGNGNAGHQGPEALREVAQEALGLVVFVTGCMVS